MAKSCYNVLSAKRSKVPQDSVIVEEIAQPLHGTLRMCSCHSLLVNLDEYDLSSDPVSRKD